MNNTLQRILPHRKTGSEPFHVKGHPLGVKLADFWAWSMSDLLSNASRGIAAEFLVAHALGLAKKGVREEWASVDLVTHSGIRIEVKSSAYLQSWHQSKLSTISFRVPATKNWDSETNILSEYATRTADVYVFALLAHQDKATIDPFDVSQWIFFVLPTFELNERTRSQTSIALRSLQALAGSGVHFEALATAVTSAFERQIDRLKKVS